MKINKRVFYEIIDSKKEEHESIQKVKSKISPFIAGNYANVRVNKSIWQEYIKVCKDEGFSATNYLNRFMDVFSKNKKIRKELIKYI